MPQRPSIETPDDDPRLWLEEIDGEAALAWVDEQSAATLARYGDAAFAADRDALRAIYDAPDKIPYVSRRGPYVYNFWQDREHVKGIWRRSTLPSFRGAEPDWELLLDLDALAAAEGEDWVWHGASSLPGHHDVALVTLSPGGSDAAAIREFDLTTRSFRPDGFRLPAAKSRVAWVDRDTLLVMSTHDEPEPTTSGYARRVRLWRRGTRFEDAPVLFEVAATDMTVSAGVDRSVAPARIWYARVIGFFDSEIHLGTLDGAHAKIDVPTDARVDMSGDWLTIHLRTPWAVDGVTYPGDAVLGIGLTAFMNGARDFKLLFEPGPRRSFQSSFWARGKLTMSVLDDLANVYLVVDPAADWSVTPLGGVPAIGVVSVWPLDVEEEERDGTLLMTVQDPVTPSTLALIEPGKAPAVLKRSPAWFDTSGLTVTRHEAVSTDGERIPYVQVGPERPPNEAPVLMSGYGGFGVTERPWYSPGVGKVWLERGGVYVMTHIRGGGEFGTRWHDAGRNAGKRLSHDDFAAIAADLVLRGVTVPRRIAAMGGSNGGILISNMFTRYPDRFGALLCTVPLIDMRRYSKLLAGASWMAEYGDPDKPSDWAHLSGYSAYHAAIDPARPYPPILIATTRKDDRVHPGHARKFCAKLQELGLDAHYFEPAAGGHSAGKDNAERAIFTALGYRFLRDKIGWDA